MRILVTGSRSWTDSERIRETLAGYEGIHQLAHGGAAGADRLAGEAAAALGWSVSVFPAEWSRFGRSAGVRRNAAMLESFAPALVVAFWVGSSAGTADMVRRARAAGIPVLVVRPAGCPEQRPLF